MTEENTEMATIDETPKPEEPPETVEEMRPETTEDHKNETPKPSRVKIREVAKQKTECQDCHKTITMKTARYTHKDTCEGKPSNIIEKPVRKNNVKPKVQVKPVSVESHEEPVIHKAPPPVSKAIPSGQSPERERSSPTPPPPNMQPYDNLTQAQLYQLHMRTMNQEIMRRRQEKANNMCQAMFKSRPKKSR